jgi:hypothetical protein
MKPTDLPPPGSPYLALPEVLPPPPRTVRHRPGRGRLLGHVPLVVWLLGLAGLGLLLLAVWLLAFPWFIGLFGSTVRGKVTGLYPAPPGGGAPPRVKYSYYVGEQEYSGDDAVDKETFDRRLYEGATVRVRVLRRLPDYPRLVEPAAQPTLPGGCLFWGALLWNAGIGFVVWALLRRPRRQRRLVREGLATAGRVVAKEADAGRRAGGVVQYAYRAPRYGLKHPPDGPAEAGAGPALKEWQVVTAVGPKDFAAVEVGAPVLVLYDPGRPSRSLVYAFAEYEAVGGGPPAGSGPG